MSNLITTGQIDPSTGEREWPVQLYRKTEQSWQVFVAKNSKGLNEIIKAAPREGYIALRRIKVRLRLTSSEQKKKDYNNNNNKESDNNTTEKNIADKLSVTVIRRKDRILISSNLPLRTMMLKFQDEQSCVEFSDKLVTLNPPSPIISSLPVANNNNNTSSINNDGTTITENNAAAFVARSSTANNGSIQQYDETLSYIGRLLQDPDFITFVNKLESCLLSTEDGLRLLDVLVNSSNVESCLTSNTQNESVTDQGDITNKSKPPLS